jgi:hypothetical protein
MITVQLAEHYSYTTIRRALDNLRYNRHEIENRGGGSGRVSAWYVVSQSDPFVFLADHILEEMRGMTHAMKRKYLAEQLENLADPKL